MSLDAWSFTVCAPSILITFSGASGKGDQFTPNWMLEPYPEIYADFTASYENHPINHRQSVQPRWHIDAVLGGALGKEKEQEPLIWFLPVSLESVF
jgi:hypothetical protein